MRTWGRILWACHRSFWVTQRTRVVSFFQRGKRGWADADTWNWDTYLARVIAEGVTHIEKHSMGTPYPFFEQEKGDDAWRFYLTETAKAFADYVAFMENSAECRVDLGNKHHEVLIERMKHLFDHYTAICD